jgi:transcriptional repressor NrdR
VRCPSCGSRETRVLDKRDSEDLAVTRRRRECHACSRRFTTYERPELASLMLVKKDGRRQEFDREKLRGSLQKACTKLPISAETISRIVEQIESELRARDQLEVPSSVVGDLVMQKLHSLDKVAYIRFASVYRAFADVSSFEDELRKVLTAPSAATAARGRGQGIRART